MPAGFIEREEKSPPSAPKAFPMAADRAVPVMFVCEKRMASSSDCPKIAVPDISVSMSIENIFFIFLLINVCKV